MAYRVESRENIIKQYNNFVVTKQVNILDMTAAELEIRRFFKFNYFQLKHQGLSTYKLDFELGLRFYNFMNNQPEFDFSYATNPEFWQTIACFVIPDFVADRWGYDNKEHFYDKSGRYYPFSIYWYINCIWQGDEEKTRDVADVFNSDEILNFSERPTKIGVNLDLFRELARHCATFSKEKGRYVTINGKKKTIARAIFVLNTSKLAVIRPEVYPGGIKGYVDMLFKKVEEQL